MQCCVAEIHEPYEKTKTKNKIKQKRGRLHARKRTPGTNSPKIVKYKSPSGSKLNRQANSFI